MTEVDFKKRLIGKINQIKNEYLLQELYRLVENEESDTDIYKFSEEELNAINEAREQYKRGEFLNSDAADKEIDTWLGE
jgi:hypothetical protein